jgi:hypothetical protein
VAQPPQQSEPAAGRSATYVDKDGQATENPATAVHGAVVEYDSRRRVVRRTRFFMAERELPWLPVSETAFLLWVLAVLAVVWLSIGVILKLT